MQSPANISYEDQYEESKISYQQHNVQQAHVNQNKKNKKKPN